MLLNGRGGSSSADVAQLGLCNIEDTAGMVVGPDGPGSGETDEQMEAGYWGWMVRKLRDAGIGAAAAELRVLAHDVEIGERLRRRLEVTR